MFKFKLLLYLAGPCEYICPFVNMKKKKGVSNFPFSFSRLIIHLFDISLRLPKGDEVVPPTKGMMNFQRIYKRERYILPVKRAIISFTTAVWNWFKLAVT